MSFRGGSFDQARDRQFTSLHIVGGNDCSIDNIRSAVDLRIQGGAIIHKGACVLGNLNVSGMLVGDVSGNILTSKIQEQELMQGIEVIGNLVTDTESFFKGNVIVPSGGSVCTPQIKESVTNEGVSISSNVVITQDLSLQGNVTFDGYPTPSEGDMLTYSSGFWKPISPTGFEKLVLHQDWNTSLTLGVPTIATLGVKSGPIRWTTTLMTPAMYDPLELFSGSFRETINLSTSKTYRISCMITLGAPVTSGVVGTEPWSGRLKLEPLGGGNLTEGMYVTGEYVAQGTSIPSHIETILFPSGGGSVYPTSEPFQILIDAAYGNVSLGGLNLNSPPSQLAGGCGTMTVWEIL